MGFILSKTLLFLLLPPSNLIIIMAAGVVLLKRYPRLSKIFIVFGLAGLYLISIKPVSNALIKPLESTFSPLPKDFPLSSASSIVVLTGGVADLSWVGIKPAPSHASLSRLVYAVTIYRRITGAKLIISGGSGDPDKPNISEADAMKDTAVALGVPAYDIIVENKSRNTIESVNALKGFVGEKKLILVTSASHMKRAVAMFKKAGINVIPGPTDYLCEQKNISSYSLIPHASSLMTSSVAFYEYAALSWYGIIGEV